MKNSSMSFSFKKAELVSTMAKEFKNLSGTIVRAWQTYGVDGSEFEAETIVKLMSGGEGKLLSFL